MRFLVTGANGFLGHAVVRRLVAQGEQVRCLVRPGTPPNAFGALAVERVEGDVTRPQTLPAALEDVEVVLHLAGVRRAPTRAPFWTVNAEGTRHVCEAMLRAGARRLVLAGSLAACGPSTPARPHVEEDPLRPEEWYGESKAEAERVAFSYGGRLEVTVIRPPRVFGPGDRENLAFFRLVARGALLALAGGPRPLSGVDVEDVVGLMLLQARRPEAVGEAFFVAAERPTTLEALQEVGAQVLGVRPRRVRLSPRQLTALAGAADAVSRLTGRPLPLNRKLARQLLAPAWTCAADKAARLLGFRASRDVDTSVRESVAWYREKGWL